MNHKSKERFGSRVDSYIKGRPSYPESLIGFLVQKIKLKPNHKVADIGSGTGLLTQLFLDFGSSVFGIEPNKEMREAGETFLNKYSTYTSINASAEVTTLENKSVDLIIAGQAFHWFDKEKFRLECKRILKDYHGYVILLWNDRDTSTPFGKEYENFIDKFNTDYHKIKHNNLSNDSFATFFGTNVFSLKKLKNKQILTLELLHHRIRSTSYLPDENHKNYQQMLKFASELFDRYQKNGKITLDYNTIIYYSKMV